MNTIKKQDGPIIEQWLNWVNRINEENNKEEFIRMVVDALSYQSARINDLQRKCKLLEQELCRGANIKQSRRLTIINKQHN